MDTRLEEILNEIIEEAGDFEYAQELLNLLKEQLIEKLKYSFEGVQSSNLKTYVEIAAMFYIHGYLDRGTPKPFKSCLN